MPRFVVLEHDHPEIHWDFMLEAGEVLWTWRLARPPDTAGIIAATPLPDHRLHYLDYEGPVSRGRGQVKRWDAGLYREKSANDERLVVILEGKRLRGEVVLEKNNGQDWSFQLLYIEHI